MPVGRMKRRVSSFRVAGAMAYCLKSFVLIKSWLDLPPWAWWPAAGRGLRAAGRGDPRDRDVAGQPVGAPVLLPAAERPRKVPSSPTQKRDTAL